MEDRIVRSLIKLREEDLLPKTHSDYIRDHIANKYTPKVIYDIGACVLHWTDRIRNNVWPDAKYHVFDVIDELEPIYKEANVEYNIGVLSDAENKDVTFYMNKEFPGGNSYYRENPKISRLADEYFSDAHGIHMKTRTLDSIVEEKGYPLPDFIKMDVQGAELDIVKGAPKCMQHAKHVVLESSMCDYNMGAPKYKEVNDYMISLGFTCHGQFSRNHSIDADYHFERL